MVDIDYKPIKKIAVHEIIKNPLNNFIKMKTKSVNPNALPLPVRWAEGVVFTATAFPPTEKLVNEEVDGTIHWQHVEFAEMPEYQQVITNQESGTTVGVIDFSNNTAVTDFIRWLKRQPQWFGDNSSQQ